MADVQSYAPYRTTLLTKEQVRELCELRPGIAVRDTIIAWIGILAGFAAVALVPTWWMVLIAIVLIGTRYYALTIIGHDGLHRRLFRSRDANDLWNDLLILGPICAITHINRTNHMDHHRETCLPGDPDRHKYIHDDKEDNFSYVMFLSGLQSLWPAFRNIFLKRKAPVPGAESTRYTLRDMAIILGWQAALIVGLTWAIGWWAYPVLWILPIYVFAYRADLVRVFCEHSMLMPDKRADETKRMITYTSHPLEKPFFAPHNMNYHTPHHLWPAIPYYNLPRADALIREYLAKNGPDENLVWRRSYFGYILFYLFWTGRGAALAASAR
ncbi:MAG: fatty acid desaturase [Rhizobiaceae bacterium]|nr:fatty acid desaturase [Rhizobiaceae bacterium]